MNVGGVPWTAQSRPELKDGFRNVMLLCVAMLGLVLLCFIFPALYSRIMAWRRRRAMRRSWSLNRKSFLRRTTSVGERTERGGYLRLFWHRSEKFYSLLLWAGCWFKALYFSFQQIALSKLLNCWCMLITEICTLILFLAWREILFSVEGSSHLLEVVDVCIEILFF